jgi:hypothetical protein
MFSEFDCMGLAEDEFGVADLLAGSGSHSYRIVARVILPQGLGPTRVPAHDVPSPRRRRVARGDPA